MIYQFHNGPGLIPSVTLERCLDAYPGEASGEAHRRISTLQNGYREARAASALWQQRAVAATTHSALCARAARVQGYREGRLIGWLQSSAITLALAGAVVLLL